MRPCYPNRPGHRFEPASGWCANGCGVRDDGRVVSTKTGTPLAPPVSVDITEPRRSAA
ncbi:hypothetical protein GCM10009746_14140 [Microbacterium paludicola]